MIKVVKADKYSHCSSCEKANFYNGSSVIEVATIVISLCIYIFFCNWKVNYR